MNANECNFRVITSSELDARVGRPVVAWQRHAVLSRQGKLLRHDGIATDNFWDKVHVRKRSECWPWSAALTSVGVGLYRIPIPGTMRITSAPRIALLTFQGTIDDNLFVLHKCDNGACCNPYHLYEGTQSQNQRDCAERGRSPVQTLTADNVREIRRLFATGRYRKSDLARLFNVQRSTVTNIFVGRSWSWLT